MKPTKKLTLSLQTVRILTTQERSAPDGAPAPQQEQPAAFPSSPVCSIFTSCYRDCP
ncbi:hypothetical protein ACMHYB_01870 [Sorangium sp. So ce1128]